MAGKKKRFDVEPLLPEKKKKKGAEKEDRTANSKKDRKRLKNSIKLARKRQKEIGGREKGPIILVKE